MAGTFTLRVRDVAVERGGRRVLADVGFDLRSGEVLAVTGPNGSGKSTLLRVLAGLLPAASGAVALDPPDERDAEAPVAERAHHLGHLDALKAALTPLENLTFAAAALGRPAAAALRPREALDALALGHVADLPCGYLSAGQRRRVALARLLVAVRPLWLLDEPATALDAAAQAALSGIMGDHVARGGLIVAATHAPLGLPARTLGLGRP